MPTASPSLLVFEPYTSLIIQNELSLKAAATIDVITLKALKSEFLEKVYFVLLIRTIDFFFATLFCCGCRRHQRAFHNFRVLKSTKQRILCFFRNAVSRILRLLDWETSATPRCSIRFSLAHCYCLFESLHLSLNADQHSKVVL